MRYFLTLTALVCALSLTAGTVCSSLAEGAVAGITEPIGAQTGAAGSDGTSSAVINQSDMLDKFVYFADATSTSTHPEVTGCYAKLGKPLQTWTEEDKAALRSVLKEILERCPDLLAAASGKKPLALIRVRILPARPLRNAPPGEFSAEAGAGYVVFGDDFFGIRRYRLSMLTMLTHELIHEADQANTIAYSKLWTDFAEPRISKLRLRAQLSSPSGQRYYSREVSNKRIWPSLYGTINMCEGLAEYLACVRNKDLEIFQSQSDLNQEVVNRLLKPSQSEQDYRALVTEGLISFRNGHLDEALKSYYAAERIDPNPLALDCLIANCYEAAHKSNKAILSRTRKAKAKIDLLHLPCTEPLLRRLFLLHCSALEHAHHYREANSVLDEVFRGNPFDDDALRMRAECHFQLGQLGLSLQDLYMARGFRGLTFYPMTDIQSDPEFAKRAIEEISTGQNLRYKLNARAQYYLQLADLAKRKQSKRTLLTLALADYVASLDIDDKYKLETALCCLNVCLRLNDATSAKTYYERAVEIDSKALLTQIAEVRILEATGDSTRARNIYPRLKKSIEAIRPNDAISFIPSFEYLDSDAIRKIDAKYLGL